MRVAVSFTGGKDSTLVLTALQLLGKGGSSKLPDGLQQRCQLPDGVDPSTVEVTVLVTFAPAGAAASFKAHNLQFIQAQAAALGVPHAVKEIDGPDYLASYQTAIKSLAEEYGVQALATGECWAPCCAAFG
jgi:diphthamide synthase (EF-2-diphthine--ammonia ligase)